MQYIINANIYISFVLSGAAKNVSSATVLKFIIRVYNSWIFYSI